MNLEPPGHGNDHQKKLVKMREVRLTGGGNTVPCWYGGEQDLSGSFYYNLVSPSAVFFTLQRYHASGGVCKLASSAVSRRPTTVWSSCKHTRIVCCYTILAVMYSSSFTIEIQDLGGW